LNTINALNTIRLSFIRQLIEKQSDLGNHGKLKETTICWRNAENCCKSRNRSQHQSLSRNSTLKSHRMKLQVLIIERSKGHAWPWWDQVNWTLLLHEI